MFGCRCIFQARWSHTENSQNCHHPHFIFVRLALCKDRSWCVYFLIRLWSPGARDNAYNDLRYIWGGFAYLQDMMDHGIVRVHTSNSQPLGVYLQQMPYPCYVDDGWVWVLFFKFCQVWLKAQDGGTTATNFSSLWGAATHCLHRAEFVSL